MATAPSQATDNPFGSNPFERTDPNFQLWADAERLARERWERFRANHMARMPLDSASPEEFIKFKVALTVALFDAWAGPYCAFRPWRGKEGEFNEVLFDEYIGRFADQHIEHVTKYANTRGLSHAKTVILETRIAINQRRAHWKAEGYRIAREEREVEAAATNGPTPEPTRRIEETSKNPANVPPALRKKRLTLIRSKRKDGESMESLARRFAVSKDSLYAVAKGDTRKCGPETAELILRKLNVTPEEWNAV